MDQRTNETVSQQEIDQVIEIAMEATRAKRKSLPSSEFVQRMERLGEMIVSHSVVGGVTMVILAGMSWYFESRALLATTQSIGILSVLCTLISNLLMILSLIPFFLQLRRDPYKFFFEAVKSSSAADMSYAVRLSLCDINAIQYVLAYYKYERNGLERRGAVISGSIEKLGLFPAFGTVALLYLSLSNSSFGHGWIQMLVPVILAFHLMNLSAFGMTQKMDRVISLLEFSISSRRK